MLLRRLTPATAQKAVRWGALANGGRRYMGVTLDPMTGELTALPDINVSFL
jgi:hypothetical protein